MTRVSPEPVGSGLLLVGFAGSRRQWPAPESPQGHEFGRFPWLALFFLRSFFLRERLPMAPPSSSWLLSVGPWHAADVSSTPALFCRTDSVAQSATRQARCPHYPVPRRPVLWCAWLVVVMPESMRMELPVLAEVEGTHTGARSPGTRRKTVTSSQWWIEEC